MSKFNFPAKMIFGRDGTQALRSQTDAAGQLLGETLSQTTSRRFYGPAKGARLSAHCVISAGITGSVTVWYSNLVDPDETNDAHWVQDANAAATVTLSGSAVNSFLAFGNVLASYCRIKITVSGGSGTAVVWVRAEGDQSAP